MLECLLTALGRNEDKPDAATKQAPLKAAFVEARNPAAHLLIAEDNAINRTVAQGLLKKLGYRNVETVNNGQEALDAVRTSQYDLILMDCLMPELDGYEATRALRERGVSLPIIAMTANTMAGDREKCLSAGMNDYVAKPISAPVLAEVLDRWLAPPEDK